MRGEPAGSMWSWIRWPAMPSLFEMTKTTYKIAAAEIACPGEPTQTYYVGLPLGDDTNPMMALLRYAADRCYANPTNP